MSLKCSENEVMEAKRGRLAGHLKESLQRQLPETQKQTSYSEDKRCVFVFGNPNKSLVRV